MLLVRVLAALLFVSVLVPSAFAGGDENSFLTPAYFKRVFNDVVETPQKPLSWDKKDWLIAGGVVGASFAAFAIDDSVRKYYENPGHQNAFLDSVSDATTHFGDYKVQLPLITGSWVAGMATGNETLKKIAADGAEASFIAAGLITPALVYISGRALPDTGEDAMKFRPFTPMRYSYPSGHTTEAFAMATVLDQNLRRHFGYWPTPFLYALAAGTAHSRVYDDVHYVSDIILGAGIGWAVGYWIANKPRNADRAVLLLPRQDGAAVAMRF
ncbi:MAG: phosphatase PAP2 family protein [Elusimicrobiales bacterium]|nr:phosphatase PAP2 family protein [Elusimicrobiales bacterium]